MTDYGTSVSPYLATGYGSDSYSSNDTGTSTLTTDGHLLATDTFTYGEGSSNVAYDSITFANGATVSDDVASASDNYSNTDSGAITRSDSTTTSYDHFTLGDTHWTSGSFATVINDASHSESFNDASTDCDIMSASGEKNTAGDSYSFTNSETSYDVFFLSDDVYGQWSGTYNESGDSTHSMVGSTAPSGYQYTLSSDYHSTNSDGGQRYFFTGSGTHTEAFADSGSGSGTYEYVITGPSETTETLENTVTSSGSSSGSDPSPPPELNEAGTGVTIGGLAASNVGTYPNEGAMHQGTTPGNLDTSQGLASAVGGELMHPIGFEGAEIQPTDSGSGILLDEPESPHGSSTPWQSHPSTVGYSRPWGDGNTVNGGTSNANGTSPGQDSGTSNGSTQDETARLSNFNGGAAQNATSTQAAPTARAQQKVATATGGASLVYDSGNGMASPTYSTGSGQVIGNADFALVGDTMGASGNPKAQKRPRRGAIEQGMTPDHNRYAPPDQNADGLSPEAQSLIADLIQMALDVAGVFEQSGIADGASGVMSLFRGKFGDALMSGVSAVPLFGIVGDAAKAGRLGKYAKSLSHLIELAKKDAKLAEMLRPMFARVYSMIRSVPLGKLPAGISKILRKTQDEIGQFLFKVGKHGKMPTPRPGQQSHHGLMSAWMKKRFPGKYNPDKAPAILMPDSLHRATYGVYNEWRAQMRKKMGGVFDWSKVSDKEIRALSEAMFDAAGVPANIRQQYWAEFAKMTRALKKSP